MIESPTNNPIYDDIFKKLEILADSEYIESIVWEIDELLEKHDNKDKVFEYLLVKIYNLPENNFKIIYYDYILRFIETHKINVEQIIKLVLPQFNELNNKNELNFLNCEKWSSLFFLIQNLDKNCINKNNINTKHLLVLRDSCSSVAISDWFQIMVICEFKPDKNDYDVYKKNIKPMMANENTSTEYLKGLISQYRSPFAKYDNCLVILFPKPFSGYGRELPNEYGELAA